MGRTAKPILRKLGKEERNTIANAFLRNAGMPIKKYKNHAVIWCGQCNTEERISLDLAKQIEKSHLCPFCYQRVELHKEEWSYKREVLVRIEDVGYYLSISKRVGQKPRIYHKQVAYWDKDFYARNIMMNMYRWIYRSNKEWKLWYAYDCIRWINFRKRSTKSYNSLDMQFYDYEHLNDNFHNVRSKREFLESLYLPEVKSNLKKIFIDNHLNREQILGAIIFDLKSVKEIYKYNTYICKQGMSLADIEKLNIHYLDYLKRNKIPYRDYCDYMEECRTLKIKPSKPKDFYKIHEELGKEVKILKEKNINRQIKKVAAELMDKAFKQKNIEITPLMDVRDVVETGAGLHNCIKSYIDRYANRQTELYCLRDKGKRCVAIEVKNGELIQARADHNTNPSVRYKRVITKWLEEVYV